MVRAGIEPATLGLEVLPQCLRPLAMSRKSLQTAPHTTAGTGDETHPAEPQRYSNPYSAAPRKLDGRLGGGSARREPVRRFVCPCESNKSRQWADGATTLATR